MIKGLIQKAISCGDMKIRALIIISIIFFTVASWSFFLFSFFILSEDNSKLEDSLDEIEDKVGYLNETVHFLSEEKMFEKEMMENLAYYLPEGFSSRLRYIRSVPLDLELNKARVYFIYRHNTYKVDFVYSFDSKIKIDRESTVDLVQ